MMADIFPLLCLDTTGPRLMLALYHLHPTDPSQGLSECFRHDEPHPSQRRHSAMLGPVLARGLAEAGLSARDLRAVAVNAGPGSFTGIRTGLVTARMLGQLLAIPVAAFSAFELLADVAGPTAIFLDALQGRAYHAVVEPGPSGPVFLRLPALVAVSGAAGTLEPPWRVRVSQTLHPFFPGADTLERLSVFTPEAMARLYAQWPERYGQPWANARALYLQEPNITLKPAPEFPGNV